MASILLLLLLLFPILSHAAIFTVTNNCPYTVWPAAIPVGGGQQLNPGQSWSFNVPSGTTGGRVWGRTGCGFGPNGQGHCQTGDCGGALHCTLSGSPPTTLAEFSLGQQNNDYYDISVIDGYNVPMGFSPTNSNCHSIRCAGDIIGQCPGPLRVPGGCNNSPGNSQFFKNFCGDSYTYPQDNKTFSCPTGTDYRVTFCP